MRRREVLAGLALTSASALAGCGDNVGRSDHETGTETVERSSNGIAVVELTEYSSGDRCCYHDYEAQVVNRGDSAVEDVTVTISVYDENGQRVDKFSTSYRHIPASGEKPLQVSHGPEQGQCYCRDLVDYEVEVNYE